MSPGILEADIEEAALDLFAELGWKVTRVMYETFGPNGQLGRDSKGDVILPKRLRQALHHLNPTLPPEAIELAVDQLTRDRTAIGSLVAANRDATTLLKDGVKIKFKNPNDDHGPQDITVRVINWEHPLDNDFLIAQQLWVQGELYPRRADLVGFVNGLPLVFIELKGIHKNVEDAFRHNLTDYRQTIPHLFHYNGVVILSNGFESRVGSLTAGWDHFKEWKRIAREDEPPTVALETVLRGVCDKERLLDLLENFTLFSEQKSAVVKVVGQNHQFLGVNNAIAAVRKYQLDSSPPGVSKETLAARRRLGVFWHTQGAGKSFSMVFFSQKILRRMPGNWTFVIITDREDLDDQIYKTFVACGAVKDADVQAKSGEHLQRLLKEDHRYVFTLIQKFRTDIKGARYPKLSDRSDIIVIADEAHRTQYDTFAMNMRHALPNAAFIGFTGTPLLVGEEKTLKEFGDYVSIYNFRQAIEDNATVPLYYEARIPTLELTNEDLDDDLTALLEEADLDEEQQKKVEREFARQYHFITREDRLETIARDLVDHFVGLNMETGSASRSVGGAKAMVVSIDKLTAVRMFEKVKAAWAAKKKQLEESLGHIDRAEKAERTKVQAAVHFMATTDMAVVLSSSQGEVEAFKKKGLEIAPHRKRMVSEDLATKFKDESDPLRLVFVCAMWMTGFDVPSCGAIYLDKPMKNHTLMQTIARANRVYEGKESGLIVDYVGVFRNLQKALAIYGAASGGGVRAGDTPVQPKEVLLAELAAKIAEAKAFCASLGVDVGGILPLARLKRIIALKSAMNKLQHPPETKKTFYALAMKADKLYRSLGLDPRKAAFSGDWGVLLDLCRGLQGSEQAVDISAVMAHVEALLDDSIDAEAYAIREPPGGKYGGRVNLGEIDFAALARYFEATKNQATVAQVLISATSTRVDAIVRLNPTRGSLRAKLDELIGDYNNGARSVGEFFEALVAFLKKVEEEGQRAAGLSLTQEALAVYDLLLAADVTLSAKDRQAVKKLAAELPKRIAKKLVIDWRKNEMRRASVRVAIKEVLRDLPDAYDDDAYEKAASAVYEHVFESYWGEGKSKYGES